MFGQFVDVGLFGCPGVHRFLHVLVEYLNYRYLTNIFIHRILFITK